MVAKEEGKHLFVHKVVPENTQMSELQIRCNHRVNTTDVMYFKNCKFYAGFCCNPMP